MPISDYHRALRQKVGHMRILSPGAAAVVLNERGEVLLQQRRDDGRWGLPGGAIEPGEDPADTIVREVWEETGLHVVPERIVGVYGGTDGYHTYPNGDEMAFISVVFECRVIGGELNPQDGESLALRYFPSAEMPPTLFSRHRMFIDHALAEVSTTRFRHQGALYP
ncbi:MAG: NUDIX hydrolase [Aggregatilineales bacterium]